MSESESESESPFALIFRYPIVLFDYDRTIMSLAIDWPAARENFRTWLAGRLPGFSPGTVERIDEMEAAAIGRFPDRAHEIFEFRRELEGAAGQGAHTPQPQVIQLVRDLAATGDGRRLIIISNNLHATVEAGLRALGLADCFELILGIDDVGLPKPSTKAAGILSGRHRVDLQQSILVGDSPSTDGEFCRLAGIPYFNIQPFTTHCR